jgi:hypothetical protein
MHLKQQGEARHLGTRFMAVCRKSSTHVMRHIAAMKQARYLSITLRNNASKYKKQMGAKRHHFDIDGTETCS